MTFEQRLHLKTTQTLVVTPQLQQAIRLLLLSNQELELLLDQEADQNPLLIHQPSAPPETAPPLGEAGLFEQGDTCPPDQDFDNVWTNNNIYSNDTIYRCRDQKGGSSLSTAFIETIAQEKPDLRAYLREQVTADFPSPLESKIAFYCCDWVDECGYFRQDLSWVASQVGASEEEVLRVLKRLQRLDPTGVFARTLGECLQLQLEEKGRWDPAIQVLVENLELLAAGELEKLEKMCGVSREDFIGMIQEIRHLNPKPGADFSSAPVQAIIPDVLMEPRPQGGWQLRLNEETLPRVRVDTFSYASLKHHDQEASSYLKKYLSEAQALVKAVHQRAETILKVASAIVKYQKDFFLKGIVGLKPLTLKEIAEEIGMHESTISRVTSNKFMSTPRGVFELKYFFSNQVSGGADSGCASEVVRHKMKQLIEEENPSAPYSDEVLVQKLAGEGISLARRTVAKYREFLGIPSSSQRKREKLAKSRFLNLSLTP